MKTTILLLTLAIVAPVAYSQDLHCDKTKTIAECFALFVPEQPQDPAATAATSQSQSLAQLLLSEANTGVNSVTAPQQSTMKDFLSLLSAFLDVPTSDSSSSKPLTLDHNFAVHFLGGDEQRLKLEASLAKPDLSDELTKRLTDATALAAVKKDLSDVDDVTVSLSLSPSTKSIGRSITPHRDVFESMLVPRMTSSDAAAQRENALLEEVRKAGLKDADLTMAIKDIHGITLAEIEAIAHDSAMQPAREFAERFTTLLNNQPQLFGSAIVHSRKDVAGPDERSFRLAYEMGFRNLNAFYATHPDCATTAMADAAACGNELLAFATDATLDNDPANRVSVGIEYKMTRPWEVALPQYSIDFGAPKAHTFVYSFGYGRNTTVKNGRVDASIDYEDSSTNSVSDNVALGGRRGTPFADSSGATNVHDRLVASVTYTQKINANVSVPVSLVYANHASFLGNVDRKLNAHIGFQFKLPTSK